MRVVFDSDCAPLFTRANLNLPTPHWIGHIVCDSWLDSTVSISPPAVYSVYHDALQVRRKLSPVMIHQNPIDESRAAQGLEVVVLLTCYLGSCLP